MFILWFVDMFMCVSQLFITILLFSHLFMQCKVVFQVKNFTLNPRVAC